MASKGAYAVISMPKICWGKKTQPWMSLFLLALETVVVAHQGEPRPPVNDPVLSCFENRGWGTGSSKPAWALCWADLWAKTSPAWAGQWHCPIILVLMKALRAITTDSGILMSVLGRRNHSPFIPISSLPPSWSAVLGYLVSGFLSLTGIISSYELNPNSWSLTNWLLGSVCIVPLMEPKSLFALRAKQMKMCFLSLHVLFKIICSLFEWSSYICWNMQRVRTNIFGLKNKFINFSVPFLNETEVGAA